MLMRLKKYDNKMRMSQNLSINHEKYCRVATKFLLFVEDTDLKASDITELLDISQSLTSRLLNGKRSTSKENWAKIAEFFNYNLDSFIEFGKSKLDGPGIQPEDSIEWEHFKTIKRFKNKQAAKDLNNLLVQLEKEDPDILYDLIYESKERLKDIKSKVRPKAGEKRPRQKKA